MGFLFAYLLIAVSCILISARTLVAYVECSVWLKITVYLFFTLAWFAPMIVWNLQPKGFLPFKLYNIIAKGGYFIFGFSFIFVMIILVRDIVWSGLYLAFSHSVASPAEPQTLSIVNYATLVITFLLSIYAIYEAEKLPRVLHYEYSDNRITRPLNILLASDIHITKMMSSSKVKELVKYINAQNPDIILLPGDIADDRANDIQTQIRELGKLKAPLGIYYTLGNHETYFDAFRWESEFSTLGWQVLHNSGVSVDETGLYIAGLPDAGRFPTNIKQAIKQAKPEEYRIMLSHLPVLVDKIGENKVDMQVSGHTHGGQIFPFNFLSKWGNKGYLFGEYTVNNTILLITRGVGYWGPQMRLSAPNDITIIHLKPEQ